MLDVPYAAMCLFCKVYMLAMAYALLLDAARVLCFDMLSMDGAVDGRGGANASYV